MHHILSFFNVHAVHPIVDYASVALMTVKPGNRKELNIKENEAARIILGAPGWTKVVKFLVDPNLFPLDIRIDQMAA